MVRPEDILSPGGAGELLPAGREARGGQRFAARRAPRPRRDVARRRPQDELRPVLSGRARRLLRMEREENAERWLGARQQRPKFHFTVSERRRLKVFFDDLDEDGSGHVTVEELLGPLLAFGLADDEAEVKQFVEDVDADATGSIDFKEFVRALEHSAKSHDVSAPPVPGPPALPMLSPVKRRSPKKAANPSDSLASLSGDRGSVLELDTLISTKRRARLLATIAGSLPTTSDLEGVRAAGRTSHSRIAAAPRVPRVDARRRRGPRDAARTISLPLRRRPSIPEVRSIALGISTSRPAASPRYASRSRPTPRERLKPQVRYEENRLRQRLFVSGGGGSVVEQARLEALNAQHQALKAATARSDRLVAALGKAVAFDQHMDAARERARAEARAEAAAKGRARPAAAAAPLRALRPPEPVAAPRAGVLFADEDDPDAARTAAFLRRHRVHTPADVRRRRAGWEQPDG